MNINKNDYAIQDMNEIINHIDIYNKFNNIYTIIKMIYIINKNENFVRIFRSKFVEHNKDIFKTIYNGNEYELQNEFKLENIDINIEDNLEIKLNGVKDMISKVCLCKYFKIRYIKGKIHK
jgi:hypothetical protein